MTTKGPEEYQRQRCWVTDLLWSMSASDATAITVRPAISSPSALRRKLQSLVAERNKEYRMKPQEYSPWPGKKQRKGYNVSNPHTPLIPSVPRKLTCSMHVDRSLTHQVLDAHSTMDAVEISAVGNCTLYNVIEIWGNCST